MRVLGIITEYNPFHNGHLYQLEKSIEATDADFVVAVMSGNFTQRGEFAIFSKWTRAKMAVECGIDLVIELPFAFACNNAEYFAKGAVSILNGLGCVTHLSFGSESGDIQELKKVADFLTKEEEFFRQSLKKNLASGLSYPKSRSEAILECLGQEAADVIRDPNNILAVEYIKQLNLTKSDIIPITVKRIKTGYHELQPKEDFASASAIRKMVESQIQNSDEISAFIPSKVYSIFSTALEKQYDGNSFKNVEQNYYKLIVSKILTMDKTELSQIFSVSEGLENKLKKAVRTSDNFEDLIQAVLSKRYTSTRVSRILTHIGIGLTRDNFEEIIKECALYARVLGFNEKGAKLLKQIKKSERATIPCITNVNKEVYGTEKYHKLLSYDFIAADLYNLIMSLHLYENSDHVVTPFRKL